MKYCGYVGISAVERYLDEVCWLCDIEMKKAYKENDIEYFSNLRNLQEEVMRWNLVEVWDYINE